MALHEVESAEVFETSAYRAKAGPGNTGEWRTKMGSALTVMSPAAADRLAGTDGVRVLEPIGPRMVPPAG